MKKIAIIGSSGGNLYNLGGAEPEKLLQKFTSSAKPQEWKLPLCSSLRQKPQWTLPKLTRQRRYLH